MPTLTHADFGSVRSPARAARPFVASMLGLAVLLVAVPVLAQTTPDSSAEQGVTPMDQMDLTVPQPGQPLISAPAKPGERSPFFDDSKVSAQLRSFYFDRDKFDPSRSEAWAIGGSVTYKSGYMAERLALGGTVYGSYKLYGPDEYDGTLLLKPGQQSYTVLGQAYGEFKFTDRIFGAVGRKEYNTPYINAHDVRMTPNTFEGITAYGTAGGQEGASAWRFGGGYITKIKEKNSDSFVWMSRDAGANVDRGVYLAGANVEHKNLSVGAINYYSQDIINIFYTEAGYALPLAGKNKMKLAAQFSDQRNTGDNLLTGQEFSAHQWGLKGDLGMGAALFTLAYTDTASGTSMRSPWSGYPGYTSVQVEDFNRAGESAALIKMAYDLSKQGIKGTSAYALWVHGTGVSAPVYNEDEYDFNLQWAADKGDAWRGMSIRLRYARINQRGGGDPAINDFRVILNYDFPRP